MKIKRLVGLLLIVCMLVGLFYPTGQVSAVENTETALSETENPSYTLNGKKYEVYYEDDFSDGGTKYAAATAGFTTADYSYIMNVENNALMKPSTVTDSSQYRALFTNAGDTPTTNYSVSAAFKMKDTSKFTTVTAYANTKGVGYEFGLIGTYFRIYNRAKTGTSAIIAGGNTDAYLATTLFGDTFDATTKEVTLRLEASTINDVVTLKGYATYNGVEKLVCEATSTENTNMSLKSGLPGMVSSDIGAPISWVSITSLGKETDSNCLYSDDMISQTGYRSALGYALSDNSYEYTWNNENLTANSSGQTNTYSAFKGIANAATLQNYTISADVVEATSDKANGLVAYMTLSGSGGSTGYEFRLWQGNFSIYGRNTSITAPTPVSVSSLDGWNDYTQGKVVRLSMTVLTSNVSASTGTVRIICAAKYNNQVKCIFDETYTGKTVYQGAPGIRTNDTAGTIDNVKVTAIGSLPYYADFEENPDIAAAIFGSNLAVTTETTGSGTNTYGVVSAGKTVYAAIGSSWTDYAVETDVTMIKNASATSAQYAGIIAGYIEDIDKGYEFDIYENYNATTEIYMARLLNKNDNKVIRSVRFDFTPGEIVKLRMEVSGTQIKCYADGELLISETITLPADHTGTEIAGSIGLRAITASVKYDNIAIKPCLTSEETGGITFPFVEDFDGERAQLSKHWDQGRIVKLEETDGNRYATLANYYMPEEPEEGYVAYDTGQASLYLTGVTEAATWTDYVYEADVTLTDAPIGTPIWKMATIVGAVQEVASGNTTTLKGYEFSLCYNGSKFGVRLYDRINGGTLVGKDASSEDGYEPCEVSFNETVRLKMIVSGNTIQCYVNDELMIDYVAADENTTFTGTIGLLASGHAAKFDNIIVSSAADYYPLAQYRSDINNYTHPYKCGHVFGGWYTDAGLTTALSAEDNSTTYAYAKWVAEEVLSVKAQLPAGQIVDDNGRTVMRIVTTTDCDAYPETGFDVSTVNQSKTYTDTRLFTSIKAKSEYSSVAVDYTPSGTFHADSKYFSTIILYNLKATDDHLTKEFTIKPFWVTPDGTKVYGVTRVLTIQEGIEALTSPMSL